MPTLNYWGLESNPYTTVPISKDTLNLFVGREKERRLCQSALGSKSIIIVEGSRGVGTTSFANAVRFTLKGKRQNFTPEMEVSTGPGWNREILLANILSNLVWSLETEGKRLSKNRKFLEIKRATHQVRETFKNIGVQLSILGSGGGLSSGKQAVITTPPLYPITTLSQYLVEVARIARKIGYKKEIIVQVNNLDVETMLDPKQLQFLLNDIRDTLQIEGYSWFLVGDVGLRNFISGKVDRLDDIIDLEISIPTLTLEQVYEAIERRIQVLKLHESTVPPVTDNLIKALYRASAGRLRQIFGVATRLLNLVEDNSLIERIDLDIAVPLLKKGVEDRIKQNNIQPTAEKVLKNLVATGSASPSTLREKMNMPISNVSRALKQLKAARLVSFQQKGKEHIYSPLPDVTIVLRGG